MADWKDSKVRTEGAGVIGLTSKRLQYIVACGTPKCPEKTGVPWIALQNERTLAKALVEHQGIAYSALGEWAVWPMTVTRTMQSKIEGFIALCPRCSIAVEAKQSAAVINILAGKTNIDI
jgi:hypothetical protein